MFGRGKNAVTSKTPVAADPLSDRKSELMERQREAAQLKAAEHILKPQRPFQYAFVELDPKPEMPLDSTIWGNPATNFTCMTSYNSTFQDPKVTAERRQAIVQAFKEGRFEDEVMDCVERQNAAHDQHIVKSDEFVVID